MSERKPMSDSNRHKIIKSRTNETVIRAAALMHKKARDTSGLFCFEGIKLLREAASSGIKIAYCFVTESLYSDLCAEIDALTGDADIYIVPESVYEKLTCEKAPQGVAVFAEIPVKMQCDNGFVMLFDNLSDPGNAGAVIRSAEALNCTRLIFGAGCADIYSPKTVRASMGSVFRVSCETEKDIPEEIEKLKASGYKVYAAILDERSVSLTEADLNEKTAVVIGNEGHGISEKAIAACNAGLYIPMQGKTESLNASVATAIIMYEAVRRRSQKKT